MFLYLFKVQYRGYSSSTAEAAWTGMGSVVASHRWEGPHYYACNQPGWSGHFQCSYQATPISGVQPAMSVERPTRWQHPQRTVLHWSYWSQGDSVFDKSVWVRNWISNLVLYEFSCHWCDPSFRYFVHRSKAKQWLQNVDINRHHHNFEQVSSACHPLMTGSGNM